MGETFGRYQVLKRIGRGGMAEVFLARFSPAPGVSKDVVVKRILPAYAEQSEFRKMFLAEARLSMRLSHGNIVQVFDAGETDEALFLAMEHIDGVGLDALMDRATKRGYLGIPPVVAALILIEVLKGLHYAHTRLGEDGQPLNLVHRDISPDNVMVSFDGEVKVTDFGIAKAAMAGRELTRPGIFKGKFTYGAPEQARGEAVDARADVYACGIVLYELVAGANPSANTEVAKEVGAGARQLPRFPVHLADPEFVNIITRALAPLAGDRYSSAQQFQQALVQWAAVRAGSHFASAVSSTMRALFEDEVRARSPKESFEPAPRDFLAQLGARLPINAEAPTRSHLKQVDRETNDGLPAFALEALAKGEPKSKPEESPEGMTIRHVTAIGLVGSALLLMLGFYIWTQETAPVADGRDVFEDAMRRKIAPPTPLAPDKPAAVVEAPSDAGTWAPPPPPVFKVDKVPAEFRLSESHLVFVDGAAFVEWTPTSTLTLRALPRTPRGSVGPMFAFQRAGEEGNFTRIEPGKPVSLAKQAGTVQLFAVSTGTSYPAVNQQPARVTLNDKKLDLPRTTIQFVGDERRVTVTGLDPRKAHVVRLTSVKEGGKGMPVLVLLQGDPLGRPAMLDGAPGTTLLSMGEHLLTNARGLQLVGLTATGLKRDEVLVRVDAQEPAPVPAARPTGKKPAPPTAVKLSSQVAEAKPHFERAADAINGGQTAEARSALSKGLRADPRNASGHYWAGVLAQRQADTSGALFSFQLFLKVAEPGHPSRNEVERLIAQLEASR